MSKRPNLSALADAAGSVRAVRQSEQPPSAPIAVQAVPRSAATKPPSRQSTVAVTGYYPPQVRMQLKILAAEQDRSMESMVAEALNDLFAKYGKPEIAPVQDKPATLTA
jgi:hypothetical protein